MYQKMLEFVETTLIKRNGIKSKNPNHTFRNRFEHIKRVLMWLERILPDYPECDHEVAKIAAIFHDVGYGEGGYKIHHSERGADIFKEYAKKLNLSEEKINKIAHIVEVHSNKELIKTSDNLELILVLEADLLDEEGALGLAFDLMAAGSKNVTSYSQSIDEIMFHTAHILEQNPMRTPLAIKYWEEKKALVKKFIDALTYDIQKEID